MITDSTVALWAAFHSAKEALLLRLESPMPYTQHILLTPAAKRDIARASLQGEIVQGKLDLLEMRSVQERFSHAAQLVVKRSERAQTLLSPCAGMPVEIVRQILLCALTPEEPRAIIRASSVCSTWRSFILKEPHLFTHADWNRWPNWLIKDWCSRARDRLLHVELGNRTPVPKVVYYQYYSDYDQLKAATKGSWGELRFTSGHIRETLVLPLLQSLQIDLSQPKDDRPSVVLVTLPNVRRIDVEGVALRPTFPLTNLVELSVTPLCHSEDWGTYYSTWSQILEMSPALVKLTIRTSLDYEGFSVDPRAPPIAIPTLQSLTFVDDDCGHYRSFTSLLLAWSLPSLRRFRTVDMGDYCSEAEAVRFLDALTRCSPLLESLRIEDKSRSYDHGCFCQSLIKQLATQAASGYLPWLSELYLYELMPDIVTAMREESKEYDPYESIIRKIATRPRMRRMKVPVLSHACAEEMIPQLELFEVAHWQDEGETISSS